MNIVLKEFAERICAAVAAGSALRLRGSGSKDWYGEQARGSAAADGAGAVDPVPCEVLDTRACTGIVAYEPTELVITAYCGTPLAELEAALAERGQMLAFEPPHFGPHATMGGMLAAGLSGPRRQSAGSLRDFVLGVDILDGRGAALRFGGQVMKNVAGYDVSRLMAGSLGTLGLMTRASLKVLPLPAGECSLRFNCGLDDALACMAGWSGKALPLSASAWHDGTLTVRLSGAAAAVDAARRSLGGSLLPQADEYWRAVREQSLNWFQSGGVREAGHCGDSGPAGHDGQGGMRGQGSNGDAGEPADHGRQLWRVSLPAASAALPLPSGTPQLVELGGMQRWVWVSGEAGEALRGIAAKLGGHATLFRGAACGLPVFQPLPAPLKSLHRRLKHEFDPAGVFNPGRMYAEL